MGRYIDENLQPGEKVLYSTNAHWIFFLPAILLWILVAVFLVLSGMVPTGSPLMLVCWALAAIVAVVALYKTVTAWFHRWTTETDVTNLRVVHRRGVAAPFHQLVGPAGHRRHHHGDVMSGIDFAFDVTRDVADSVDIGDGRTAEFHHEAAHDDACIPCEDK